MKPLPSSQRASLEAATVAFREALRTPAGAQGVEYLRGRGIDLDSPEGGAVAEKFRLGFVATDDVPGFERFVGRLAIPNICASGHVVHMKFRALGDEEPKYDSLSLPSRLFNLQALNEADSVLYVTEGEVDAISLGLLGAPAVAIPGASSWKRHHVRVLDGFERIVLVQDDDEAGADLADRLRHTDLPVHVVRPPKGHKDVNSALAAGRADDLLELLERTSR